MGEVKRAFTKKVLILLAVLVCTNLVLFVYAQIKGQNLEEFHKTNQYYEWLTDRYRDQNLQDALTQIKKESAAVSKYVRSLKAEGETAQNATAQNDAVQQQVQSNTAGQTINSASQQAESQQTIEEVLDQTDESSQELIAYYQNLSEDDQSRFQKVLKAMREKLTYLAEYQESVQTVLDNAENMKRFKLFSKENTFSNSNILRTAEDFTRVKEVQLVLDNDRAVDAFVHYYNLYYIAAGFMIVLLYGFFTERENGMWQIVHNTPNGRSMLAVKRLLLIIGTSFGTLLILYVTTLLTSVILYGGVGDFGHPIQTIADFGKFTHCFSRLEYAGILFLLSWFILCGMSVILWMLFTVFRNRNHTLITLAAVSGVEILLYQKISIQSVYNVFHYMNLVSFLKINELYSSYLNWGFGSYVFSVSSIIFFALGVLTVITACAGIMRYDEMRPETKVTWGMRLLGKINVSYQKAFAHYPAVIKELHKLVVTGKGIWVIVFAVVIAGYFSAAGQMTFTDQQNVLDQTYIEKGGKDYSGITEMIQEEEEHYREAQEKVQTAADYYNAGEISLADYAKAVSVLQYQQSSLNRIAEFRSKSAYIQKLQEEDQEEVWMISDRGYEEIFGKYSSQREMILLLTLIISVMLIISECISLDYRTGMELIIHSCSNGRSWILRKKIIASTLFTIGMTVLLYGIDYWNLYRIYGMPYLDAPLRSLTFMEETTSGILGSISILTWMILRMAARMLIALITMIVAMIVSRFIGKKGSRAYMIAAMAGIIGIVVVLTKVCGII